MLPDQVGKIYRKGNLYVGHYYNPRVEGLKFNQTKMLR